MKFKIAYIIFIISIILYANTRIIGAITPRHIMTGVMAVCCFRQNLVKWTDNYFSLYLFFCGLFGLSSLVTGYIAEFVGFVFSWLIPGIIAYWATRILRDKYNAPQILVYVLLGIGFIDALTTIGQFLHIPLFLEMPDILRVHGDKDFVEDAESGMDFFGLTIPGLFGSDVYNGYVLVVFTILIFCLYKKIGSFGIIPLWLIALVALFFVQERTAFYLGIAMSLFLFYMLQKTMSGTTRVLSVLFFISALIYLTPIIIDFVSSGNSRYTLGLDATNRDKIYEKAEIFVVDHLFLGGWFYCKEHFYFQPHNILLHAIVRAGFVGLILVITLLAKQVYAVARISIIYRNDIGKFHNIAIGLALLAFNVNSFMHNHSVIEGEVLPWLLWGAFGVKSLEINKIMYGLRK